MTIKLPRLTLEHGERFGKLTVIRQSAAPITALVVPCKKLLALAAVAAFAAPSAGMPSLVLHRGEEVPGLGWAAPKRSGRSKPPKGARRDPSRLQLKAWKETPCEAPEGYFWRADSKGMFRLYAKPGDVW